jgi:iron complex outermembrane receptor protein
VNQLHLLNGLALASAVSVLVAQPACAYITEVTGVRLKDTPNGVEVILETPNGKLGQIFTTRYGETFVADIITTRLRLPSGNTFRQENPAAGIREVQVSQINVNSIRVKVIGTSGIPNAQIGASDRGFVISLADASDKTAVQPTPATAVTTPSDNQPRQTQPPVTTTPSNNQPRQTQSAVTTTPSNNQPRQTQPVVPTIPSGQTAVEAQPDVPTASSDTDTLPRETQPDVPTAPSSQLPEAQSNGDEEIEIVVTGEEPGRYTAPSATSATRTDTPLRDTPQSIQVIPRRVIEDQQVVRVTEATRNVSGVARTEGYGGATDNYTIRGFAISNNLRNGFKDQGYYGYTDVATLERVEVLKGPASVLYGQVEPGGVVNYITKQPLSEPYYAAEFTGGSYDFYRPSIDISGPLTPDKNLLYRLNVAYESSGSFRDFVNNKVFVISPVLSYKLGDSTTLTLEYEHIDLERTFDRGFPAEKIFFDLPISLNVGERSDIYTRTDNKARLVLDHRFNENLRIRSGFSAQLLDSRRSNVQPRTFRLEADGRTLRRRFNEVDDYYRDYSLQTDLIGKFNTGSIKHEVLLGFELNRSISGYTFKRANFPSLDILNPVYGLPLPTRLTEGFANEQVNDSVGIYFQNQVALLPNLKLLAGGRFDFVNYDSEDIADIFAENEVVKASRSYEAFSPRVGIVYQPIEPISLYASYSRSFKPNFTALTSNRQPLDPERGTQYEVGMKAELLGGRLSATVAAFQITKENIATTDPNDSDFSVAAGEFKSRGFEVDLAGEITPGWKAIATYAYTDAFVSKDNNIPEGDGLINVPRHSASLWTTYEIQSGALRGLGFGAGLFFVGEREAELPNNLVIPSYVRTDATLFYRRDNYKLALTAKNLLDTKYFDSQGTTLYPGAPLTLLGTVSVQF